MNKLFIAIVIMLLFANCKEKKAAKPLTFISISNAKKMLSTYTGRQDSIFYLHRYFMQLDGDTIGENVLVSEMVSDPHPMVSVYFPRTDTLIFIPVPAVSATTPEVEELDLHLDRKIKQIGVWYTRKDKEGTYSYRVALYWFFDGHFTCLLDEQLYRVSTSGKIEQAKVLELGKEKKNVPIELYLVEAEVSTQRIEEGLNNGPLLIKKKNGARQLFKYLDSREKYVDATAWAER